MTTNPTLDKINQSLDAFLLQIMPQLARFKGEERHRVGYLIATVHRWAWLAGRTDMQNDIMATLQKKGGRADGKVRDV